MLSYQHEYHAGNHADILKHYCLFEILSYYSKKGKPFSYIDTHAGRGLYYLDSTESLKNKEYQSGIAKLMRNRLILSARLKAFQLFLRTFEECTYPGSPCIAQKLISDKFPLQLFELHPVEFYSLRQYFDACLSRRVTLLHQDGLKGLLALLPPASRRGVILLDPSYEVSREYGQVVETVRKAHKKFATGCYIVWYPYLAHRPLQGFFEALRQISTKYIRVSLWIRGKTMARGLQGSGVWVINPPFHLDEYLRETLPQLTTLLGQDQGARHSLEVGRL
ncbi:MAG: 23S rRNA (adenine(2030)-N(6))-methyltransferase RlmJ [Neisseriaceae bacterium]